MRSFASRQSEILTLKFKDFEDKDFKKYVYYYAHKKNQRNKILISNNSLWKSYVFSKIYLLGRGFIYKNNPPKKKDNYRKKILFEWIIIIWLFQSIET